MTHRSVIRITTVLLAAALTVGCEKDDPISIAPEDRFNVTPLFVGMDPGATQQVAATVGTTAVPVTWESSNQAVATVTATGLVTALTAGFSAVTATMTSDPTKKISSNITVNPLLGTGLTNGVATGPLSSSAARGSTVLYRLFVPPGRTSLTVTLRGGSGDADIYVRRATPPTTAAFTCRSENGGNDEDCVIANPATGTWYILIALWDPYSGASVRATYAP